MRIKTKGQIPEGKYGWLTRTDTGWDALYDDKVIAKVRKSREMSVLGRDKYRLLGLPDGDARVIRFADLHRHSDCSLKDSIIKIKDLVEHTEYAGALTDHGNMYGFLEYYEGMKKAGKKPILGFEGYMEDLNGNLTRNHVILLAKNNQGYKNLLKLSSESFDHFRSVPYVTWDMLEKYHEGIICASACLRGVIPDALLREAYDEAEKAVEKFISCFGPDDFYIELQKHGIAAEDIVRPRLISLAQKYGLKVIATTDSHYVAPDDREAHDVVLCIRTGSLLADPNRLKYDGSGYYLHTSEDMEERFKDYPEALDNTLELAEKCNVSIKLNDVNLPDYKIPEQFKSPHDYLLHIAKEGYETRFAGTPCYDDPVYRERFRYEAEMIEKMGFSAYFIIVWDFIHYARSHDILVGPGRGSAAGSMIAYCMGITDLDPIKFNLLFERFLNPERVSMPDIDTDIAHNRRPEVIQYLINKYGTAHVCRIVTFGTFAAKQSILDVTRVLGLPVSVGTKLAGMVPKGPKMTLAMALANSLELSSTYQNDSTAKRIIDLAMKIEGGRRHASQHACGVCIAPGVVSDYLPTSMEVDDDTGEKALTAQVTMTEVEKLSLIKMDLLGLKNLSVIDECLQSAEKNCGRNVVLRQISSANERIRFQDIPLNDRATYEMLRRGDTGGVFQFEGQEMTRVLQQMLSGIDQLSDAELGTVAFEQMIAAVALYRPGPMEYIPDYIKASKDPSLIVYDCPEEKDILAPTYGVIVYQEQVMQLVQKLAGYSLGRADTVRKAMGKKKHEIMEAEKQVFLYGNKEAFESGKDSKYALGCMANGISEEVARHIWDKMERFASYAFNRSHAACYAYIGYITAYLSCHWPKEFYAGMLNAFIENSDKCKAYLGQAHDREIELQLPDIQTSQCGFSANKDGILFGLQGISGVKALAVPIVQSREEKGPFTDLEDLYNRIGSMDGKINKTSINGLVFSGALRSFSDNKAALLEQYTMISKPSKSERQKLDGQCSLFSGEQMKAPLPDTEPFSKEYELEKEASVLGMFVSEHPAELYERNARYLKSYTAIRDIHAPTARSATIHTMGLATGVEVFLTKKGEQMGTFTLGTKYHSISCIIFPDAYRDCKKNLEENKVFWVTGQVSVDRKDDSKLQLFVSEMKPIDEVLDSEPRIVVEVSNRAEQNAILDYVKEHPGDHRVVLKAYGLYFPIHSKVSANQEQDMRTRFKICA